MFAGLFLPFMVECKKTAAGKIPAAGIGFQLFIGEIARQQALKRFAVAGFINSSFAKEVLNDGKEHTKNATAKVR